MERKKGLGEKGHENVSEKPQCLEEEDKNSDYGQWMDRERSTA
jgi:hypothetical protein